MFNRWIDLERKFAFEKIDELMLKESSWSSWEREGEGQFQVRLMQAFFGPSKNGAIEKTEIPGGNFNYTKGKAHFQDCRRVKKLKICQLLVKLTIFS